MNFGGKIDSASAAARSASPGGRRHEERIRLYFVLCLLDITAVIASFALGSLIRFGDLGNRTSFDVAIVTLPIFIGIAINSNAYTIDVLRSGRTGVSRAFGALMFAFGSFLFISYYFKFLQEVSRLAIIVGMAGSFLLVAMFRFLFGQYVGRVYSGNVTSEVVILDHLSFPTPNHVEIVDAVAADLRPNTRDPMMLDRLAKRLRGIDRVVIACRPEDQRAWAVLLKGANIRGEIVANEFDEVGAIGVGSIGGRATLVVATGPLSIRNRIVKRMFDLSFAVPAVILLAPVLVITAIAIKLDSRGPVLFRQKRVGRGNELFEVFKFRSMHNDHCDADGKVSARRDDDRITRVGRLIRATSIDELPQLLNVLFGSMSIVGPRPHALGSLAGQQLFWEVDERYWHRHVLKPGITGLAQVRGLRGATHRRDDLTRRLQSDLEYIAGWSVVRDVAILLSTIKVVVHQNAF